MSTDANEPKATRARRLIKRYALGGIAPGLLPFPLIDAGLLLGVQLKLIHHLAKVYGVAFSKDLSRSLISALVGGGAPISLGASLGKLVPGYGQFVSPITGGLLGALSGTGAGEHQGDVTDLEQVRSVGPAEVRADADHRDPRAQPAEMRDHSLARVLAEHRQTALSPAAVSDQVGDPVGQFPDRVRRPCLHLVDDQRAGGVCQAGERWVGPAGFRREWPTRFVGIVLHAPSP